MVERFSDLDDLESFIIGAVLHESGHVRFTNREIRQGFRMAYKGHSKFELVNSVGQMVEDVVIERAQCNELAGARHAFLKMWKLLFDRHTPRDADASSEQIFSDFVFHCCRHSVLKSQWSLDGLNESKNRLNAAFAAETCAAINSEMSIIDLISSTADGAQLSTRLLKLIGIEPLGNGVEEGDCASDAVEQGDPAQGSPEATEEKDREGGEGATSDSPAGQGTSIQSGDSTVSGGDSTYGNGFEGEDPVDAAGRNLSESDLLDLVSMAVQELQDALPDDTEFTTCLADVLPGTGLATSEFQVSHQAGLELRFRILTHTMMASARLSTLLKAQTESRSEYTKQGKIVPSRLWKLQSGNLRVFRKTVDGQELDTAIKVLLDRSGSMSCSIEKAVEAACFLPMAFEDIGGVSTSVDIFPGTRDAALTLKRFDDRIKSCLDSIATVNATGGTPLGAALKISGHQLMDFPAARRILVVITDGRPDDLGQAEKELKLLANADVEIIGIGIGVSLKHLFPDFISVKHVGELTEALYHLMERKLISLPLAA